MKRFALAGNPNCGKTTLFNALTGSTQHVGNWPGVTVDKKDGIYKKSKEHVAIVDLPGIYSLSPYTPEEIVSRNFICDEKPDCIINIVDATNLERNLYLTTQLLEIDVPMVLALNMMDVVKKNGDSIDIKKLEKNLGIPVVEISAALEDNIDELMERAITESNKPRKGHSVLSEGPLSHVLMDVTTAFVGLDVENPTFHAVKLIESDELEIYNHQDLVKIVDEFKKTYNDDIFGTDLEAVVADQRYKYIENHYSIAMTKKLIGNKEPDSKTVKADKILTNRFLAIPIFLIILFLVFHLTFTENLFFLGGLIKFDGPSFEGTLFEGLFFTEAGINSPGVILTNFVSSLTDGLASLISDWTSGLHPALSGLINDGIVAGVFSVLSFVPQILFLFLLFSILEDTGYMARIVFILDRIFKKFGLTGRAFIPMIMGFGCSVPAMINTRTLADEKERVSTIRVIPFFSCGAKLPILTAIAGAIVSAFGFGNVDLITYAMYIVGIITAIIAIIVMRNTTMRGDVSPFIMELPTYHMPRFKPLVFHLWDKLKHYIEKAFTIILVSTIVIWFLSNFGWDWHMLSAEESDLSILSSIGKFVSPIFTPLGFGAQLNSAGWVFAVAAITGLIAKENVIATFFTLAACLAAANPEIKSILESLGNEASEDGILEVVAMIKATGITWPALISFIVFNMTTIPCFAAIATAKAELPEHKLGRTILFWIVVSYIASTIVYLTLEFVWPIAIIILVAALAGVGIWLFNKRKDKKIIQA
ncbi:MAG: ferrous iron transporter B [Anaeroplasmataceae bacterium]